MYILSTSRLQATSQQPDTRSDLSEVAVLDKIQLTLASSSRGPLSINSFNNSTLELSALILAVEMENT